MKVAIIGLGFRLGYLGYVLSVIDPDLATSYRYSLLMDTWRDRVTEVTTPGIARAAQREDGAFVPRTHHASRPRSHRRSR